MPKGPETPVLAVQIFIYRTVHQVGKGPCLSKGRGAATAAERAVGIPNFVPIS